MYLKRTIIRNLRGFSELDFSWERPDGTFAGWTVITGENASGKTALLKAIALALVGPDVSRALQPSLRGWVTHGCDAASIAVQIVPHDEDQFSAGRRPKENFWSELELQRNGGPEVSMKPGDERRGKRKGPLTGPWAENAQGWLAVGYGPFRRLYGASPEAQRVMSAAGRIARFATLFKEDATLGECEIWLKDLSFKKLESKERESQLLDQVLRLLNDGFLRNGMSVDRVDSDGLWLRDAAGTVLPLTDMSEGYRAALAMMIDIVRHLADAHEGRDLVGRDQQKLVVPHCGVVLIDEIDAHLHPEWQRQIGFWMKERFPKIQFIVTTHSALVCQAADPGGIFRLPAPGSGNLPFQLSEHDFWTVVRSKPDTILLSEAFGLSHTRSPQAVENRQLYASLAAKRRAVTLSPAEERKQLELFERWIEPDAEEAT
ncbi:MAG: AAA family ATPase [Candidatus Schekmanbacteria bacterium]|nr:AAA family ATPase [Candidatus Schekmanbacteria bacterium]